MMECTDGPSSANTILVRKSYTNFIVGEDRLANDFFALKKVATSVVGDVHEHAHNKAAVWQGPLPTGGGYLGRIVMMPRSPSAVITVAKGAEYRLRSLRTRTASTPVRRRAWKATS